MEAFIKIHPFILLLNFLINIFAVFVIGPCLTTGLFFIFHLAICFFAGLKFKTFIKVFIFVCLFSISLFILNYLYVDFEMAILNLARAVMLTFISVSASLVVDFEGLLLFLMSKKMISPTKGYPIFAAINSIEHLQEEKRRLNHLAKMRGLGHFRYKLHQMIPLLVFAIRHSQRAATAMIARGLNDHKIFHYDYGIKKNDWIFGGFVFLVQVALFSWHFFIIL